MFAHESLDPRSKLALTVAVVITAVAADSWVPLVGLFGFVLAVVVVGRGYGLAAWLHSLRPILYILPLLMVLNTLFYVGGAPILAITVRGYPVGVTTGGLATASLIAIRLIVIAGVAAWFAGTTGAETFEAALGSVGVPWSVAFLLSLSIRLVPAMRRRFTAIEEAQRSRGLDLSGGPIETARDRIPMFVPFLSAIIRYGYELSDALTARGYDQIESRTTYVEVRHNRVDYVVYVVAIVVLASTLVV